jgi:hypothetical protein
MKTPVPVITLLVLATLGCASGAPTQDRQGLPIPAWLQTRIVQFQQAPVGNPPRSIWKASYQGRTVYYLPAQCCDQFSELYDDQGALLCAPDGGISGAGDGRCPDFLKAQPGLELLWKDGRGQ